MRIRMGLQDTATGNLVSRNRESYSIPGSCSCADKQTHAYGSYTAPHNSTW
jgi:hypothetical protein